MSDQEFQSDQEASATSAESNLEDQKPESRRNISAGFLKEVLILALGLFIGFFWTEYAQQVGNEGHLVVFLLVIILCLVRYIFISRQ